MADFTFLFNRKGALYPLDFTSSTSTNRPNSSDPNESTNASQETVTSTDTSANNSNSSRARCAPQTSEWPFNSMFDSTLVHLCSKVIVSMPTKEIDRITDIIPAELFVPLFKASLYPVKDNSIDVMLFFILESDQFT
jgi:hypothetical protein